LNIFDSFIEFRPVKYLVSKGDILHRFVTNSFR